MPGGPAASLADGRAGRQDAELVVLRICHHDPAHVALADIGAAGTERLKAGYLGGLVVGAQVEVEAVLLQFLVVIGHLLEQQVRPDAVLGWPSPGPIQTSPPARGKLGSPSAADQKALSFSGSAQSIARH